MEIKYPTDEEVRRDIIEAGRRLYMRGFVCANDGNISGLVSEDEFWITPSGVSKGFMTEDMLIKMRLDGIVTKGTGAPSSESKMHIEIYKKSSEILGVVHAHPPISAAFAAEGIALDKAYMQETVMLLGVIPVSPYATPGSDDLATSAAERAKEFNGTMLEHHGSVSWGRGVIDALFKMESIEYTAAVTMNMKTLGFSRVMSDSQIEKLVKMREKWGITAKLGEFK